MINKKANLALLGFMGAILHSTSNAQGLTPNSDVIQQSKKEPKKVIPKGCKEYFFTGLGKSLNEKPNGSVIIYECIASSERVAINKFNKWVDTLPVCECRNSLEMENCDFKCDRNILNV